MTSFGLLSLFSFFFVGVLSACGNLQEEASPASIDSSLQISNQIGDSPLLKQTRFHLITPTGEKIFASMKQWEKGQELFAKQYAQPAMCATNASKVLEMSGVSGYSSPLLMTMVNSVRRRGGLVIELPKTRAAIAQKLKSVFNGRIPVGSFVSGCLRSDCSGQAGDGHIALVGDIDDAGYIKIYHNNWYRPDNNPEKRWLPHMIPMDWYNKGYRRKWMATPWVYLQRDSTGAPHDIKVRLPEIDDLDPTNYYVTLTIPSEILNEVRTNKGIITDGKGNIQPFVFDSKIGNTKTACGKIKITDPSDPAGVNVRQFPGGTIQCLVPNGTSAELISTEGMWSKVKIDCGGTQREGFVFGAFAQKSCSN